MKSKILGCLAAATLAAAIVVATPATAFRGGFRGGGFHGGGFGGFHGGFRGGMFMGRSAFVPGAARFAHGGMVIGRSALAPGAGRLAHTSLVGRHIFFDKFHRRIFINNFAFFGGWPYDYGFDWWPYDYDYASDSGCWQQVWTGYAYRWVNVCYNYGYGY